MYTNLSITQLISKEISPTKMVFVDKKHNKGVGNQMVWFWVRMIFAVFWLTGLVACTPNRAFLVEKNPCGEPCWYHITPGKTTKSDFPSLLQSIPEVDSESIEKMTVLEANDSYYWDFNDTIEDWGNVVFINDTVASIETSFSENTIPLDRVVQQFGSPGNILAIEQRAEYRYVYAFFNYPEKGISVLLRPPYTKNYSEITVGPDLFVESIWYYDPLLFKHLFTFGPIDVNTPDTIDKKYQNWVGYGIYLYYEK